MLIYSFSILYRIAVFEFRLVMIHELEFQVLQDILEAYL
jgi:hypothetical protein